MPGRAPSTALLAVFIATSACYRYHVYQVGGTEGREGGNQPGTEWERTTRSAWFWGLKRQDLPTNCNLSDGTRIGIEEVQIRSNAATIAATVLTLGIWAPLNVHYRCAKPPAPRGTVGGAP